MMRDERVNEEGNEGNAANVAGGGGHFTETETRAGKEQNGRDGRVGWRFYWTACRKKHAIQTHAW